MFTAFKRTLRIGLKNFWRNPTLSLATIFVMSMVISLITLLFVFNAATSAIVDSISDKIDVSVYFEESAPTEVIVALKSKISDMQEVKSVEFITKQQAYDIFAERHKNDPVLIESLDQSGGNPFLDSLSIKAKDPTQCGQVATYLQSASKDNQIKNIDYFERKPMIDRALGIASGIQKSVIGFSILLGLIAIFIAFNTIKIAIWNSKEEISVMKLVGATNWFVRGPFLIEGILIGIISGLIVFMLTFILCFAVNQKILDYAPVVSTMGIFWNNILSIILLQLGSGIILGIFASFVAIRRHLKV